MMHQAVIGIGFGDEGKGRVVDFLCSTLDIDLVIRYSGGHQAGHHVMLNDRLGHVFTNFGCGTMRGVPTYWSKYCTVDPVGILNELNLLRSKGVDPVLYIDKRCPITTPYDKAANLIINRRSNHGSCGVGFGQTVQREEDRYSLLFGDLLIPSIFEVKLNLVSKYYNHIKIEQDDHDEFLNASYEISKISTIFPTMGVPIAPGQLLFEGSQGLLLDQDIGFFPHVSRTNCGSKNILDMGVHPHIYLVTRAYQTRHGNGPISNQCVPHDIEVNPYEQNITNYQGEFRRTILDLDLLKYAISRDEYISSTDYKSLVITCLDLVKNSYQLTIDCVIKHFGNEFDFVEAIRNELSIDKVYLSRTPVGIIDRHNE